MNSTEKQLEDYKQETVDAIRKYKSRLNALTDDHIKMLYREWSQVDACANWTTYTERSLMIFIHWAITAPCDDLQ
jgi:hypothetical protein